MKTIILVATNTEYELVQKYFQIHPEFNKKASYVKTGVGKTNTALALMHVINHLSLFDSVLNLGFCGSSVKNSKVGDVVVIGSFLDGDRDPLCEMTKDDLYPQTIIPGTNVLMSCSKFIKEPTVECYYDMEAFIIKAFCDRYNIAFSCVKIVSDLCNAETYNRMNKDEMYKKVEEILNAYR